MRLTRKITDWASTSWMWICMVSVLVLPLLIGVGLLGKSIPIIAEHSIWKLLFSSAWAPLKGDFGFGPFMMSSVWVTLISFVLSAPIVLLSGIYLTQYAQSWMLRVVHLVVDVLAGIPSVVYGVWGVLIIVPMVSYFASFFGITSSGYTLLSGGIILGIMSIPYMLNVTIEVLRNVPVELKEASLSLGATYWETVKFVVVRKGMGGIIAAFGLGISKSFGETIAVLMVVGNVVRMPSGPLDAGYPLPALIANNYGEMMSIPMYDAALMFSALLLFVIVFAFNALSRYLIYRNTH